MRSLRVVTLHISLLYYTLYFVLENTNSCNLLFIIGSRHAFYTDFGAFTFPRILYYQNVAIKYYQNVNCKGGLIASTFTQDYSKIIPFFQIFFIPFITMTFVKICSIFFVNFIVFWDVFVSIWSFLCRFGTSSFGVSAHFIQQSNQLLCLLIVMQLNQQIFWFRFMIIGEQSSCAGTAKLRTEILVSCPKVKGKIESKSRLSNSKID